MIVDHYSWSGEYVGNASTESNSKSKGSTFRTIRFLRDSGLEISQRAS
jgi:hypothetical protein